MHNNFIKLISLLLLLCGALASFAQNENSGNSLAYLEQTFPKLTNLYNEELNNCHTHYIFAVDVSGSMKKYNEIVTPALKAFSLALPAGEQVSVIPFGTDAKENTPGLCLKIESYSQKQVLSTALSTLYINDGYSKEFRRNTDIYKAIAAVNKAILNNQEAQMNVIVIITDFLNDLPGVGEIKLESSDLKRLNVDFDNVTNDRYTRVVAMQLPKAGTGDGFCLDQLQNSVFCNTSKIKRFDIIQAISDSDAISHWFEQLSRDIMTEKLRAVIQLDNERNLHPTLITTIDIDGNTEAEIHWTPNKLYQEIKIGATSTADGSNYVFKNNEEVWQTTRDTVLKELELGKLVNKKYGFRKYNENLNIGMSLPTPYDDELTRLSIEKPVQNTSDVQSGWLFTFFLPFKLTVLLVVLLIIYIILVIKAALRNGRERFSGTVDFTDSSSYRDIGDTVKVKNVGSTLYIGAGGNCNCNLDGAEWTIKVEKIKPSAFLFWKKPAFEWSKKTGYICQGKNKRGLLGRYGGNNVSRSVTINCGVDSEKLTHTVKIVIK